MRIHLYIAILALWLIALQCTASAPGEPDKPSGTGLAAGSEASSRPGGAPQASGSPLDQSQPDGPPDDLTDDKSGHQHNDQPRDQSNNQHNLNGGDASCTGASSTGGDGKPLGGELEDKTATKTTTTTEPDTPPANTPTRNLQSAPGPAAPGPGVTPVITKTTEEAGTNGQGHAQAQIPQTDTDHTDTEDRNPPAHTAKKPTLPEEPLVSPAATLTTTIAPSGATLAGAAEPERFQERALTDNTLTGGGPSEKQPDRLGQTQDNTATTTRTQPGTQHAPPITPQDPKLNPAGTTPVSSPPPQPTPITGDNALAKATDPQLSSPAATPQLQSPVTGQTPPTNAAAAADPVPTKATTSAKSTAHDGQNPTNTDSGVKNKIHALTLMSTTSNTAPEDSPQTSLTSTTESAKDQSATSANPLPKLTETLQYVDIKEGSSSSLSLPALTVLLMLTVMAVAPVS